MKCKYMVRVCPREYWSVSTRIRGPASITNRVTAGYGKPISHLSMQQFSRRDAITNGAFSRRFYPKRLTSVNAHIDTPTAESTMQGDSKLVRSS